MRTSNDADYILPRPQQAARDAVDALIRGDDPESIYVQEGLAVRYRARAMAAMGRPQFLH